MALIMIVFMIALASAILISLTDSTYVAMRLNGAAEQRIKAEYILKSAVNVAQVLIKSDLTNFDDPTQDAWMIFVEGREVPGELLAIPEPNIRDLINKREDTYSEDLFIGSCATGMESDPSAIVRSVRI
jgi:hypothetical protein